MPLASVLLFHYAIGGPPIGVKLGIVNDEVPDFSDCSNITSLKVITDGRNCILNNLSCRFLNAIHNSTAILVHYRTMDEAFQDGKKGDLHAVVHFHANFTKSTEHVIREKINSTDDNLNFRIVNAYVDDYIPLVHHFIKFRLLQAYANFSRELMRDCGYPEKMLMLPMKFKKSISGGTIAGAKTTMGAALMMLVLFLVSASMSVTSLSIERRAGVWNRQLLSGCKMKEIVTAHLLVQITTMVLLAIEAYFLLYYVFDYEKKGGPAVTFGIAILCGQVGIVGMLFGMCLSCYCESPLISACTLSATTVPLVFMSGEHPYRIKFKKASTLNIIFSSV